MHVNTTQPTSQSGEFPQPQPPRAMVASSATIKSDAVCRIQPPPSVLRKRHLVESSIQHIRRKRDTSELLIPPSLPHKRAKCHPDHGEPIGMPAISLQSTTTDHTPFLRKDVVEHPHEQDPLDALTDWASGLFEQATCGTWQEFTSAPRGKQGDFHVGAGRLPHPAAPPLEEVQATGA